MGTKHSLEFFTLNMLDRPDDGELVFAYNKSGRPYIMKYHAEDDTFRVATRMNIVCWARVPELLDIVILGGCVLKR